MPQYQLDSQGEVMGTEFLDLSPFVQGYIECLFFTNEASGESMVDWWNDDVQDDLREGRTDGSLPGDAGFSDIHPDTLAAIHSDCHDFEAKARHLLSQAYCRDDYDRTQAGRDFWFNRNGHGVGFWDRQQLDAGGLGEKLSDIAKGFGEQWPSFEAGEDSPTGYGWVMV